MKTLFSIGVVGLTALMVMALTAPSVLATGKKKHVRMNRGAAIQQCVLRHTPAGKNSRSGLIDKKKIKRKVNVDALRKCIRTATSGGIGEK